SAAVLIDLDGRSSRVGLAAEVNCGHGTNQVCEEALLAESCVERCTVVVSACDVADRPSGLICRQISRRHCAECRCTARAARGCEDLVGCGVGGVDSSSAVRDCNYARNVTRGCGDTCGSSACGVAGSVDINSGRQRQRYATGSRTNAYLIRCAREAGHARVVESNRPTQGH